MTVTLRTRKLPSSAITFYLDIYAAGKRTTESLHLILTGNAAERRRIRAEAQRSAENRTKELESEISTHNEPPSKPSPIFHDVYHAWMKTHIPNTRLVDERAWELWQSFCDDTAPIVHVELIGIEIAALKPMHFHAFHDWLCKGARNLSSNSAHLYFSRLKTALASAVRAGTIASNPAVGVKFKRTRHLPVFLSFDEVSKLAEAHCPNENVKAAFLFCCFMGLRASDVRILTWENVHGDHVKFAQKKTGAEVIVNLASEASVLLNNQRANNASNTLIFTLPVQQVVDWDLKKWGQNAGLSKRLSMHVARHTYATLLLSNGVDIYTISNLLGHSHVSVTELYTHVIDTKKISAAACLPRLENTTVKK